MKDRTEYMHWYYNNVTKPKRELKKTFKPMLDWSDPEQVRQYKKEKQREYRKNKKESH